MLFVTCKQYSEGRGICQAFLIIPVTIPYGPVTQGPFNEMGYLVDSSSHYILGVGVPALVASTIVL